MSQFQNRDQITAQTSTGSQRETHVERFISESSQSENYLVNYVRKIEFIHSSSTVYRFNPVTHLLTRSDFHRSILLVHQITEVSQEIIQKLAISIFSVTNMKPVLIETEFRSSLSSVSSSELFDFLSFCLPPSLSFLGKARCQILPQRSAWVDLSDSNRCSFCTPGYDWRSRGPNKSWIGETSVL